MLHFIYQVLQIKLFRLGWQEVRAINYKLQCLDFLGGEASGFGNLLYSHHFHGFQFAGSLKFSLLNALGSSFGTAFGSALIAPLYLTVLESLS